MVDHELAAVARATDKKIRDLLRKQTLHQYEVGGLLLTIKEHKLWQALGATSFGAYVGTVGISENSAAAWMRVNAAFSPLVRTKAVNMELVAEVGITRLYYLSWLVHDEEPEVLLNDALGRTAEELDAMTRAPRGLPEIPPHRVRMMLRFDNGEVSLVNRVIGMLEKRNHIPKLRSKAQARAKAMAFMARTFEGVIAA